MKILSITAGAANMYCGACLRDNALAAELIAQGHDVILTPLYTPTRTDEPNVSQRRVFFGGVSVYLQQHLGLFRHTPGILDRLWDSKFALRLAARSSISTNPRRLAEMTVSMLKGESGRQRKEFHKLLAWLRTQPPPDVVNLPYSLLIALAGPLRRALRAPVCCTLQGEDLFLEGLPEPWRGEALGLIRSHVDQVDLFLPVSEYYAAFMSRYLGIPESKMRVVPVGINLKGFETGFRFRTNCFTVGYLARIAPEKGLHLLAEAYRKLRRETDFSGATLEVAGYLAPEHREYLRGIEREMKGAGFAREFRYRGALDRVQKIEFLRSLSILSVPCVYDEPKGLFALEAMAVEAPVVEPRRGSFPEILEKTNGGVLFEPDNVTSLAENIYALWKDPARLEQLGKTGAQGVREAYSISVAASRALEAFAGLSQRASAA